MLEAYKTSLSQIDLFGPTNFAPSIDHVAKLAAAAQIERSARVREFYLTVLFSYTKIDVSTNVLRIDFYVICIIMRFACKCVDSVDQLAATGSGTCGIVTTYTHL